MEPLVALACPMVAIFLVYLLSSLRQVNQWEAGLKFTLGKFSGTVDPGLHVAWRIFQRIVRIDTRIRNRDLLQQSVITADNVSAMIDAVVYFKVVDPVKAALNVENFELAVKDRSKVVLRDIVGETRLDDLLAHREEIAAKVRVAVEQFVSQWGLHVELIALQDIQLPSNMQEVIARKAIAERDRQYVIIKSQADVESARNFAEAARILSSEPGAMELRRLEALQNLTSTGTSKVIFDLARPLEVEQVRAAAVAAALADDRARDPRTGVRVGAAGAPKREHEAPSEDASETEDTRGSVAGR
ncbi:MAG: SPFH domain-containing protein [Deltaproteobacteria bacterium]|nr:SPFH domain-containing protein [Deltaproteobacteria bacterium]